MAYLIPLIQRLRQEELQGLGQSSPQSPRVVILVPTAELASQVSYFYAEGDRNPPYVVLKLSLIVYFMLVFSRIIFYELVICVGEKKSDHLSSILGLLAQK